MKAVAIFTLGAMLTSSAFGAANIVIINGDNAGEGFNDPTPINPIGGNTGTTLGQQRLKVFQQAAAIFGATLTSSVTIEVRATFDAQPCTATAAVLGSAGAQRIFSDPSGTILSPANHWFNEAITNKITGVNNSANNMPEDADIRAVFNSNLGSNGGAGNPGCGFSFYLGLDNNAPLGQTSLLPVVLHELAHGLGFQTFTNASTGAQLLGAPSKFDSMLRDNTSGLLWNQMNDAQRAASARNARNLVWTGASVASAISSVLNLGTPQLQVTAPATLIGDYRASALQGATLAYPNLTLAGVLGEVMPALDAVAGGTLTDACEPLTPAGALGVNGKIALIDRGFCTFNLKITNVTAAGAIGAIIVDNVAGSPPTLTGPSVGPAIPALMISQADGAALRDFLRFRSRTRSGLFARVGLNSNFSGADSAGRAIMFAPDPFIAGSSVSHWDPIMFRNQLMEPSFSPGLTLSVNVPEDLTFAQLLDMGW
ncbi:MAG: hypothetical protein JNL98_16845 [Bryobacterales bacterium]|nr:hypothetical protein [Bryobacterales bacterium]